MKPKILPLILLAALTAAPAGAQVTPAAPAGAVAATPDYKIAAGDVLGVTVVNFPNSSTPQAMVAPDGTITLPLVGEVSVAGLTREQATRLLTRKLQKYYRGPSVTVSLVQKHPETVVLSGFLNHTGVLDYRPGLHLLDALAQMGGAMPSADATRAVLTHSDGTKVPLDLSHPETKAGTEVDLALQPGDILYIPQQEGKVSVTGDGIKQPGSIYYKENLTLLDAINASGGAITETGDLPGADLAGATLTRNGVDKKIDLKALLHDGDPKADVMLEPGDIINVPLPHNRVYIYGDVQRQGFYYYKPQDHLQDAFATAGLLPDSDTGKINRIRVDKDKKVAHMDRVSLDKFLQKGDYSGNPEVQPGDSYYIPKKGTKFTLNDIMAPITALGSLSYTTRLVQGK